MDRDWQWRVATCAPQHHLASAHYANDRIIDVPNDWSIVNEKHIGDCVQTLQRFVFIDADRLVA